MSTPAVGTPQRVAAWHGDPFGRFEYSWHDGQSWTDAVLTISTPLTDEVANERWLAADFKIPSSFLTIVPIPTRATD